MSVVGVLAYLETFTFRDDGGTLVTTEANGDFTKTVIANGAASAVACTVTQIGSTGRYTPSLTPDETGDWTVIVEWAEDPTFAWSYWFKVVTAAQADPAAALSAATITVVSPVTTATERLTLVRGDDYLNANGRALSWTVTSPSLVGATATFHLNTYAGVSVISKAMTIASTTVRVDLTSTETAALNLGTPAYKYEVVATLSGGGVSTVVQGDVWSVD